ncbi:hypothetical protein OUZ56_021645 [Daphnia magna]|uniref:Uncharacterized protein n=1 Tax=Daphnia magna TaxID=35525 RepID=A0ABR0AU47_9CRUS|nr:hypothetical protein OUZ56_021645 [Daphnia magna]
MGVPKRDQARAKREMIHPLIELRCDRGNESLQIISARSRYGDMRSGRGVISIAVCKCKI